jgi:hypothetical protein
MSNYVTKFSLNDTAYIVDKDTVNVIPAVIIAINVAENLMAPAKISYQVRYVSDYAGRSQYAESDLYFVAEAKAAVIQLLSERSAEIANLGN